MSRLKDLCENKMKIRFIEKLLPKLGNGLHYYMDYFDEFDLNSDRICAADFGITIREGQMRVLTWNVDDLDKRLKEELNVLKANQDFI